ncbi:DUF7079 family protein [Rhizorhabdus dicambivorans]|uniref:DUF7079 domain-containing protein n=1 Tax=Rhizorhabdus dicambivorans TaxID=1850238 RepID=A0A2A4FYE7_9SPHN|nr:hypothetical protein [Rhizorhabdus dicambivorans]ATE63268.1 hypothetical protein CMV14_01690 [Rhizorhabdus dicambivorans]PCE43482.1 hypothetical protein COO09_04010 [Rhizorhabdus dicambivorans]
MTLSAAEIENRLPLWTALSELFLDTEVDYRRLADAVRMSGFALHDVEIILRSEVFPAFVGAMHPVAGEWIPWDEAEVREIVTRSMAGNRPWFGSMLRKFFFWGMIESQWQKVALLVRDNP